jgi:hypothetical protein
MRDDGTKWFTALAATAAAGLALAACENPSSSLCDPGQILDPMTGYCVAAPRPPAIHDSGAGASDAGPGAEGGATGDGGCTPGTSAFGDSCTAQTDCHCPTDYCALMPGAAMGTCTRTGCDKDPSICPASYTCLDLGAFQPGLPHICYK